MSIKILPARLANQIAAGEVVERPASVVKELVENSLDAGATRIDVDIEKGGAKLIRVRDNGKGIEQGELALALSRHATSKIHTLDDLEAIMSLGFRGEALASISSVSRLTLTSRTATQEQAWSAYSEGREMDVKLQPAAHPVGSSVEVLDLFFNTPARRKFLRTEKTEFTHIDELIKRIALSRFDVTINLRHNGKMIRQYRHAKTTLQEEKRIAAVCGQTFVRNMVRISLEHQGLTLSGWITTPEGARSQSDLQYCYVNGRMMRDKLINHAIRQSYETSLRPDQYAAYVLFIDIDPHQVDVNVHPAKHEVRFHQARLVHDFIYQALSDGLAQTTDIVAAEHSAAAFHTPATDKEESLSPAAVAAPVQETSLTPERQAVDKVPSYPGRSDYAQGSRESHDTYQIRESNRQEWPTSAKPSANTKKRETPKSDGPSEAEVRVYQDLLTTQALKPQIASTPIHPESGLPKVQALGKAINVVQGAYLLMADKQSACLVSLARAEWLRTLGQLDIRDGDLKGQPLLVPLAIKLESHLLEVLTQYQTLFHRLGIELKLRNKNSVMIMAVPAPLRQQNLQLLLPDLLSYVASFPQQALATDMAEWLSQRIAEVKSDYTLSEAIQIISELEQLWNGDLPLDDKRFVTPVDFSASIAALQL